MKIQLWSQTTAGKWASVLTLLFIVFMAMKLLTLGFSIIIPLPTPFIALLGVIGFIMGIVSIIKNKDKSLFVMLSIIIGLLLIFWIAAEIAFPH